MDDDGLAAAPHAAGGRPAPDGPRTGDEPVGLDDPVCTDERAAADENKPVENEPVENKAAENSEAAEKPETDEASGAEDEARAGRLRLPWWGKLGAVVAAFGVLLLLVVVFVAQPFVIPSASMENTLQVGDRVIVDKLSYAFGGQVHRGDVVVFDGAGSFVPASDDPSGLSGLLHRLADDLGIGDDHDFVKRVVGVGGDRIRCCDAGGHLLVDGRPIDEPYLYPGDVPSTVSFDIQVPPGDLWVMGDHRSDSEDSRDLLGQPGGGFVPVNRVVGRVVVVIWPLSRIQTVPGAASLRDVSSVFVPYNTAAGALVVPWWYGMLALWKARRRGRVGSRMGKERTWAGIQGRLTTTARTRCHGARPCQRCARSGVRRRRSVHRFSTVRRNSS